MAAKHFAGVELSSNGARIVVMTLKPVPTVLHAEEVLFQQGDETRLAGIVSKALETAGVPKADVHLVFTPPTPAPGRHLLFVAPKLKRQELVQVASREVKRDGALEVDKSYFAVEAMDDAEVAEGETMPAGKWHLIAALQKEAVDTAATSFRDTGLTLRSASTSMMGILRACALADVPKQGCVAIVHLDAKRSVLMVTDNGNPRFFRDIPTTFARGGADDMLIAQAVAREIDISLVFFAQQHRPKHVDHIVFFGDADIADRVMEFLGESPGYTISKFGPGDNLVVTPTVPQNLLTYAPAIGAALSSPKTRFSCDVLPSEMRGKPEKLIAVSSGSAVLILLILLVVGAYRSAARASTEGTKRAIDLLTQYQALEKQVETLKKHDTAYASADRWEEYFENLNLYHRRLANLLYNMAGTVPGKVVFQTMTVGDAPPGARGKPAAGKQVATIQLVVNGQVFQNDIQSAQSDVLRTRHSIETTRDIQSAVLAPLTQPRPEGGQLVLPFSVTSGASVPFPGTSVKKKGKK